MKKDSNTILIRPHITEKASLMSEKNVIIFDIPKSANKKEVALAMKELYKVTPMKIATVNIPSKTVFVRGKRGTKSGYKKAYVYLKKGDTIDLA